MSPTIHSLAGNERTFPGDLGHVLGPRELLCILAEDVTLKLLSGAPCSRSSTIRLEPRTLGRVLENPIQRQYSQLTRAQGAARNLCEARANLCSGTLTF